MRYYHEIDVPHNLPAPWPTHMTKERHYHMAPAHVSAHTDS